MPQDSKSLHKEVAKSLFLAFKRLSLYAVDHPLSRDILTNLFKMFDALLKDNVELLMAPGSMSDEMIVNEDVLDAETFGVKEIYEKFKILKLDGVSFVQGLTLQELTDFVKAMAAASSMDSGKPISLPDLFQKGSEHIKIKEFHYEKIEEGEKVVCADAAGGGGTGTAGSAHLAGIFDGIKAFLTGQKSDLDKDAALVFEEMDRHVTRVADAIIQSARESGDFEAVIKKFVGWLCKHVTPILVGKKKDPSRPFQKLFDSFRKEDFGATHADKNAVIEECADEIKVAMIADGYVLHREAPKKAVHLAEKILSDEEDPARIVPRLTKRFAEQGICARETEDFVKKVETELARDEEVLISKKKLQKLVRLADRFEEEVERRVRIATEELRQANRHLADEKERSEGIMRHLADGLVVVDKSGKIVMMNPAAEKLLNREMKEAVGRSLVEGLRDEHLLAVARGSLDDKDEARITKEIEVSSKDETTKRVLRASSAVVENENGKTVGMVCVLSDVTREKEIEEVKSHFVSQVTHELRTPVVAIQKALELILSRATGAINEDQERFLSISKFNLERLNKLINDLLDISKLEAGKLVLKFSSFDFKDIVQEAKNSLISWADDKKIPVRIDAQEGPVTVEADRNRMFQVMVNLLSNALKFTPAGGEISVAARALEEKEGVCLEPCLEVTVTDTGIGIDPKDFKRIFNKFEQVSLVAPMGAGGTGLGLPIAKEIIGLHGGHIWVESQKGAGSKFIFVIPRTHEPLKKET